MILPREKGPRIVRALFNSFRNLSLFRAGIARNRPRGKRPARGWIKIALLLPLGVLAVLVFEAPQFAQDKNASPQDFNISFTGDSIIMDRVSVHQNETRFMGMVAAIRQSDAAFTNLECIFPGKEAYPAAESGGLWMATDPSNLKELQWIGFNLFAAANNHSLDYGIRGLLDTTKVLKDAGAVYAGIGENLGEARAPAYLPTSRGRVALISAASTFNAAMPAGQDRPGMRGRPGMDPLHYKTQYGVDFASLDALRRINSQFRTGNAPPPSASAADQKPVTLRLGSSSATFEFSDKPGIITSPDPRDLEGLTHSIREARAMADYVVVSVHSHETDPRSGELPAQFLKDFAHAAVDSGADVVVTHGPHYLRGIEIYKGKVIFYSLGNFIFQNDLVRVLPTEAYDEYNLGLDALPSEVYDVRSDNGKTGFPADAKYWESVVARVAFHEGSPTKVILTPITLGFGKMRQDRGVPELADPTSSAQILDKLQKLSQPFGTKVEINNGIGTVAIQK